MAYLKRDAAGRFRPLTDAERESRTRAKIAEFYFENRATIDELYASIDKAQQTKAHKKGVSFLKPTASPYERLKRDILGAMEKEKDRAKETGEEFTPLSVERAVKKSRSMWEFNRMSPDYFAHNFMKGVKETLGGGRDARGRFRTSQDWRQFVSDTGWTENDYDKLEYVSADGAYRFTKNGKTWVLKYTDSPKVFTWSSSGTVREFTKNA